MKQIIRQNDKIKCFRNKLICDANAYSKQLLKTPIY